MAEQTPIFVSLAPEVQELLADNGVDLIEELRKEGLDVEKGYLPDPATAEESRTKEVALIILASSVAFGAVSMGISRIIKALANRPVIAKDRQLVPATSPSGEVLRDNKGEPILYWKEKTQMLEPKQGRQGSENLVGTLGGEHGLRIEFSTEDK